jgi:hypothetical protein
VERSLARTAPRSVVVVYLTPPRAPGSQRLGRRSQVEHLRVRESGGCAQGLVRTSPEPPVAGDTRPAIHAAPATRQPAALGDAGHAGPRRRAADGDHCALNRRIMSAPRCPRSTPSRSVRCSCAPRPSVSQAARAAATSGRRPGPASAPTSATPPTCVTAATARAPGTSNSTAAAAPSQRVSPTQYSPPIPVIARRESHSCYTRVRPARSNTHERSLRGQEHIARLVAHRGPPASPGRSTARPRRSPTTALYLCRTAIHGAATRSDRRAPSTAPSRGSRSCSKIRTYSQTWALGITLRTAIDCRRTIAPGLDVGNNPELAFFNEPGQRCSS